MRPSSKEDTSIPCWGWHCEVTRTLQTLDGPGKPLDGSSGLFPMLDRMAKVK
jgi:hypothetical protein